MGQQQLMLIVLGVIIVGVAILMGISIYRAHAIETKKDSLIADCASIGTLAQKYYWTPEQLGGGGHSFVGFKIPDDFKPTANGTYKMKDPPDAEVLEVTATGNEIVVDDDSVKVVMHISPKDYVIVSTVP